MALPVPEGGGIRTQGEGPEIVIAGLLLLRTALLSSAVPPNAIRCSLGD